MNKWLIIFLLFLAGIAYAHPKNNRDYITLPNNIFSQQLNPKKSITVIAFTQKNCYSCTRFDPALKTWLAQQSSQIIFTQTQNQKMITTLMIFQFPSIVVDGKYKIDMSLSGSNPKRFIAIVNYLIAQEAQQKSIHYSSAETGATKR